MTIQVRALRDEGFEAMLLATLAEAGFDPAMDAGVLRLRGVGVMHGDQSVDLDVQLMEMDGHRVLALRAPIRSELATFERASLACIRGGGACQIAKVGLAEVHDDDGSAQGFRLIARLHLYADYLSPEELRVMLYLFLKEVDEIDNELASIMAGR